MTYEDWKRLAEFERMSREMNGDFSADNSGAPILTGDASKRERLGLRGGGIVDIQATN